MRALGFIERARIMNIKYKKIRKILITILLCIIALIPTILHFLDMNASGDFLNNIMPNLAYVDKIVVDFNGSIYNIAADNANFITLKNQLHPLYPDAQYASGIGGNNERRRLIRESAGELATITYYINDIKLTSVIIYYFTNQEALANILQSPFNIHQIRKFGNYFLVGIFQNQSPFRRQHFAAEFGFGDWSEVENLITGNENN